MSPSHVVVLRTSSLLPAGLLSAAAWDVLRAGPVFVPDEAHPLVAALREAGIAPTVAGGGPAEIAERLRGAAPCTWVVGDDESVVAALTASLVPVTELVGSADPPGAQLLAAVRVMDRLRSPGGCPWDAEQTHESLAKYMIEEAYEAVELIESGQLGELAEEMGDVLLQVLFHARVASERTDGTGWDVDDAARGLVDKLVRRHPHVFGDVAVGGSSDVIVNWDVLKAQEKGRTSVTEGVPLAQPALALAEKLLARSGRAGLGEAHADAALASASPADVLRVLLELPPDSVVRDADDAPPTEDREGASASREDYVGRVLLLVVVLARRLAVNPETALRSAARGYRDRIVRTEQSARGQLATEQSAGEQSPGEQSASGQSATEQAISRQSATELSAAEPA